jgi:hypothetical protein
MLLSRVYVMKIEVCLEYFVLSRVYAVKFEVCQQCFVLLSRVYVIKLLLTYLKLHYINTGQHKTLLTYLELHYINTGQ